MESKPTAIDLFSGCGGVTTGLKQAGFDVIAAVEIDQRALETYKLNHGEVRLYAGDIRELNAERILADLGIARGQLDLLAGCPPCQSFSRLRKLNRKKSAADPRNALIEDFVRLAVALMPKQIMMENVPGLASHFRFKAMLAALRKAGYHVSWKILDVQNYGVPQRRKRLIVSASSIGDSVIAAPISKPVTVRQALNGIGKAGSSGDSLHDIKDKRSPKVQEIIAFIPHDGGSRMDLPPHLQLDCHKKITGFGDVYGRMSWDKPAPTITSGCNNPSKGRFIHPEENRAITLREAAALQGFPLDYKFNTAHGKESIALMIGNALPPPFIFEHAACIKQAAAGKS